MKVGTADVITAHPHTDYDTKEVFFFRYHSDKPEFEYGYIDAKGYASPLLSVKIRQPCMAHDFSITKKYVIFNDTNLVMNPQVKI